MSNIFVFERDDKGQGWLVQKREEFASNKIGECPRYRYNEDIPIGSELVEDKDFYIVYNSGEHVAYSKKPIGQQDDATEYKQIESFLKLQEKRNQLLNNK